MNVDTLKNILWTLLLILGQALVLNHIHLFGFATPLLYVYVVILFRRSYPRWAILLWAFLIGLVMDVFTNMPGVAAGSLTFIGLLQPYVLELFVRRDEDQELSPSMQEMGFSKFFWYISILIFIYCLCFYTLEMFLFFDWLLWVSSICGSFVLTLVLVLAFENLRRR